MKFSRSRPLHLLLTVGFLISTLAHADLRREPVQQDGKPLYHDHFPARRDLTVRPHDYKRTKQSEIVKWVDLKGGQYVLGLGYDEDCGKLVPFAIYDKTDPHPAYFRFWRNLVLGTIGINDLNLGKLATKFETHRKREKEKHAGEYVYKLIYEDDGHIFPENWWQSPNIKWKEGKKPQIAPERVQMSDIELEIRENGHKKNAREKLADLFFKFQTIGNDDPNYTREVKKLENLTEHAEFVRQPDGCYHLIFQNTEGRLAPTKVIDLRGRFSSFKHSLAFGVITQTTKQATAFLHHLFIVAPGLGYALLERFFNLVEIHSLTRHAMALNMVMEALDNNPNSPFYGVLTEDELQDSIHYLRRSSTMLSDLIYFGFTSKWKVARKYIKNAEENRERSIAYLQDHGFKVYPFDHSYYALAIKRDDNSEIEQLKIYSLIKNKFWGHRPHDVVDFIHPNKERAKRNIQEGIMVGLSFMPLGTAVSIIRVIYKELFLREIHRRDMAEAGFRAHLNHNREDLVEVLMKEGFPKQRAYDMVEIAYRMIYKREMNPMEIKHTQERYYATQVENWIMDRDSEYVPLPLDSDMYYHYDEHTDL